MSLIEPFLAAVVGGIVVLIADRVRWRREDRVRWLQDRRLAYSAFLNAIDRWEELDYEAAVNGETEEWFDAPPEDRLQPLLGTVTSTRLRPRVNLAALACQERRTELEVLASPALDDLAGKLLEAMRSLSSVRLHSPPHACGGCSDEHNEAQLLYQDARGEYVTAVRAELGSE